MEKGLVDPGVVRPFDSNAMVLVRHKDGLDVVHRWKDLVKAERIVIANPTLTPIPRRTRRSWRLWGSGRRSRTTWSRARC